MKNFPLKFLDSYTETDKKCFWGREEAINVLSQKINDNHLLLFYGAAGVGKTSLITCGWRNRLLPSENLTLMIRRRSNMFAALIGTLNDCLSKPYEISEANVFSVEEVLKQLFAEQNKPMYLIFDELEEIFIAQNELERISFFETLAVLRDLEVNCKVILVIQEDFLGKLSEYEKYLPTLFSVRFRLGGIETENLQKIVSETLHYPPFSAKYKVENAAEFAEKMVQKLELETEEHKLSYFQFYLYYLCQKARELAWEGELPILKAVFIQKKDDISALFSDFLSEKIKEADALFPKFSPNFSLEILETLISEENQKQPRKDRDIHKKITLNTDFSQVSIVEIRQILQFFVENGILTQIFAGDQNPRYNINHAFIVQFVWEKSQKRAFEAQNATEIYADFLQKPTDSLLTQSEILLLELQENYSPIPNALKAKIKKSRKDFAEKEAKKAFWAAQKQALVPRMLKIMAFLAVATLLFFGWAVYLHQKAKDSLLYAQVEEAKNKKMFNALYFYKGRFGLAVKGDKYGFIDKNGTEKGEYAYDFALPFEEEIGLAKVKQKLNPNEEASPLVDFFVDTLGVKYRFATQIEALNSEITALDLRNQQLTNIPEVVFENKQLKVLLLNNNQLQNLSPNIGKLINLKILNVQHNQIAKLENLDNLKELQILDISYNKITKLENLTNLSQLLSLNVSNNQIAKLENLDNLKTLHSLDISANKITKKEGLDNLKQLKEVIIYGNVIEPK